MARGARATKIPVLSSESAKGKAIVLVPDGLDATKKIEVLVFLHGFTEDSGRPTPAGDARPTLRRG